MLFWKHLLLGKASGSQQISFGRFRVLQMRAGLQIKGCGVHLVCGAFAYGSSRTQKVVSLSSCESELHAMVNTLCDGIFLRSCLEFLTGATIEHYLFTDSSSAKQPAIRQGVGKVKHVAGKLLWIQDAVLNKQVMLIQVPTMWNLSDIGTKPLGAKRLRLLLHEIGVSTHEGKIHCGPGRVRTAIFKAWRWKVERR